MCLKLCVPVKKCLEWGLLMTVAEGYKKQLMIAISCILKHNTIKGICPLSGAISRLQFNDVI